MTLPAEQLPGLIERMIRIETKLDVIGQNHTDHEGRLRLLEASSAAVANIEGRLQSGVTTFNDHESRLRSLERRMWVTAGVALLGGSVVGAVLGPILGVGQ